MQDYKIPTLFWLGVGGIGLFLLMGNLFSTFPSLRGGVIKLLFVLTIAGIIAGAMHFTSVRNQFPDARFDLKPVIGLGVLILALFAIAL